MKMKRLLMLALTLCLCIGLLGVTASASGTVTSDVYENASFTICDPGIALAAETEETEYLTSVEAVADVLKNAMINRQAEVSTGYKISTSEFACSSESFSDLMDQFLDLAFAHTGVPTEGDYLQRVCGGLNMPVRYYSDGDYWYLDLTFEIQYYTTAAQEAELTKAVDALLAELITDGMSDYEKLTAVYDWMTDSISYDYANLEDDTYLMKYTAYAAMMDRTAVCQGYATLLYRLALEMGIDCRYITGTGNGGGHGWNIVRMGGKYYNADATWDINYANDDNYRYYLRCDANFGDHIRDEAFDSAAFRDAYPMGTADFEPDNLCAGGHTPVPDAAVAAACTTSGLTEGSHCSVCGVTLTTQTVIPATGHSYASRVTAPACTAQGYTTYTCSACGSSYKNAYTAATGHNFAAGSILMAAGCDSAGAQQYNCANCSASEIRSIPATQHYYVNGLCSRCGASDGSVRLEAPDARITNVASSGKIRITWDAVDGAVKYEVYRADSKNGNYSRKLTTTGTQYTNTGATAGETYYYYVRAIAEDGSHADSAILGCICKLPRPAITVSNRASDGKVTVRWEAVEGAAKYQVYRSTSKNGTYSLMKTTTSTSYTNTSAKTGVTYYYKVMAIAENADASSAFSTIKSRTCDLPQPVINVSNRASDGKVTVSWKAVEGAVKYEVYRSTSKDGTYTRISTTTSTSITNTSAKAGTTYYYKVRALCDHDAATSAYSAIKSRTCDLPRPDVSISRSSGKPKLSWGKVDGAVSYKIYRATSKNGTYSLVKTTTSRSWKDTTAKSGKTYYYKVIAVCANSAGNSAYSGIKSIKAK